jgi:hypothetical protein
MKCTTGEKTNVFADESKKIHGLSLEKLWKEGGAKIPEYVR